MRDPLLDTLPSSPALSARAADSLRPVQRRRLYEEVADRLREFIDVQQLEAGDRLMSERELAHRLGVSRTSVRQALTVLRTIGLVAVSYTHLTLPTTPYV